ncbi:MAG: hypothetical protein H0T15_06435 [Thermoleophilaceae bacterium]|nr:hypothetical protein [Thermoleophilaceae bacterium]
MSADPVVEWAQVSDELASEFPALGLAFTLIEGGPGRSPRALKRRLKEMSDRYTGARAVSLRQEPIPRAYRMFVRQVGIDPDDSPPPMEAISLERMRAGEFASRNLLDDALLCATMDTGIPVFAFDAERTDGPPRLELTGTGRRLVIADARGMLAELFGRTGESSAVSAGTSRILLCAPTVKGVPDVSVEEALWIVSDLLAAGNLGGRAGSADTF